MTNSTPFESISMHTKNGRVFLGAHVRWDGTLRIIYERVARSRSAWRVYRGEPSLDSLNNAIIRALNAEDCMETLHAILAEKGVHIECIEERFIE